MMMQPLTPSRRTIGGDGVSIIAGPAYQLVVMMNISTPVWCTI
jgi:hypothetical protein